MAWLLLFCLAIPAGAAISPSEVLILVNRDQRISSQVAAMYQRLRKIPEENVLRLLLGPDRNVTQEWYWRKVGDPLKRYLSEHPSIRCVVTTAGVPYTIQGPNQEIIAFDNELAAVLRKDPADQKHAQANPLFLGGGNRYGTTDARALQMVYVARLDGLDLPTITRMVEDAVAVEQTGLAGPVYGDSQGIDGIEGYGLGDFSIRAAMDRFSGAGFKASLDMRQESWKQPASGVGTQAAGAAFYMGWYDLLQFQDIFGVQGLARGSIAWHIASQEAQNIWEPNGGWCAGLMRRGAAVTLGPVREPYITAFPHGDIFVEGLLAGASVGESYWLSLPQISWAMALLGDPLYRPFGLKPRPALIARAYVAENAGHILRKGETAPLLVGVECIGPPGSSTPPVIAKAVAAFGLAKASGPVTIPPLKAGESAVVRVPSVTAGDDPTGMFRLRLEVQSDDPNPPVIVLEGRTGFSRLTGGLGAKTQLFTSPDGGALITGIPGRVGLVETATLRARAVSPPKGFAVAGAKFSPDGGHIVLALADPERKQAAVVVTDRNLGSVETLPAGSQFLRWLAPDKILLKTSSGMVSHSVPPGQDHPLDFPAGSSGSVIAGTDVAMIVSGDGTVGYKKSTEPFHAVLPGIKVTGSFAIANDLSMFGAVDAEKRLWVQRGVSRDPETIASGVERVLWGPVSHRVLVQGADKKSRVYDGRDGSWTDLGSVSAATWSSDEKRLLFVEAPGPSERYLSLLSGRTIHRVCDLRRIGSVIAMEMKDGGDSAFLLSGAPGRETAWIVALPQE